MSHETDLTNVHFIKGTTPKITYTLKDEDGNIITQALTAQTASIYDLSTGTVVPSWTDLDINGAQGNEVTSGLGVWNLPTTATAKIDDTKDFEVHVIAMEFTYGLGRGGKHFMLVKIYEQLVGG